MFGLTVRWSLAEAGDDVAQDLREYVVGQSLDRFSGMSGLCFKTWRMRPGEWFEGTYVWETEDDREAFFAAFRESAPGAPGTKIIGSEPVLMETFEVVAVAEGGAGFVPGGGPGA